MLKVMEISAKLKSNGNLLRKLSVQSQLAPVVDNYNPGVTELMNAPMTLNAKDAVMHAMCIIPVPLCAIYLGVPADSLYEFKRKFGDAFGAIYYQSLCFSINELQLFAKNRDWFEEPSEHCGPVDRTTPPTYFLLQGTFVGVDIMVGYLAVDNKASHLGIPQNGSVRRPFRLSDIRREFMTRFADPAFVPSLWTASQRGIGNITIGAQGDTH